jgi:hypothetical protein
MTRRVRPGVEELEGRVVPTLLGQQLFPSDYPWNQDISNAPVASNSAAIIAHIGTSINVHPDWGDDRASNGNSPLYGIPVNVVHGNSTAKVNVIIDNYPGESDIVPVPIPANAVIEGDYQNGPNPNGGGYNSGQRGDSHLIVWDVDNNVAYELYGVTRPSDPKLFPNTKGVELSHTDGQWHAAQESVWNMSADSFRSLGWTSADAAGLSILAGLARPDEGLPTTSGGQGAINHALRFTLPSGDVNPQYIYPASHVVSTSSGSSNLPFGARLRLMNTPAVNSLINNMGPQAQVIAHAMQQYGLVLADIGSAMYVTGTSASVDANNNIQYVWDMNDVLGLETLTAADFEVVNLAPVVTGLSVHTGLNGTAVTITGQNFSGAAGHLSVLFGGTAATSVTYVDDSHITVAAPAGSGTVDVQVQSGVNETDPNNPGDNVNNPIFGYGISATSPADQFTYTGQVLSPTNSTGSFAAPSVASGSTDTVTVTVKDTNNNAVGGLAGVAFSLALSGGASAGTFGPVSETATPGTYTATFTGVKAGTASSLAITVSGVTLAASPKVTVTPGPISAVTSTAGFATPAVSLGNIDTLTLVVKDAAGNAIGGLNGSAFSLGLSGGTSAGTFGAVTATTTPGTYTATFTGTAVGTPSTVTATVNGVAIPAQPTGAVTVSDDAVVAVWAGGGVGRWTPATGWTQIDAYTPQSIAVDGASDVVAVFGGAGVWRWTPASGTWTRIDAYSPQAIAADAAGDVVGVFGGAGVWRWTPETLTWARIDAYSPQGIAVDATGDVVATFGGAGVWRWTPGTGTWAQIDAMTPQGIAVGANGNVVAVFAGAGVWRWTAATNSWVRIDTATPQSIAVDAAGDVAAVFGGAGVWRWTAATNTWVQIDTNTPQSIAVDGGGDVVEGLGAGRLRRWTLAGGWQTLSPAAALTIAMNQI